MVTSSCSFRTIRCFDSNLVTDAVGGRIPMERAGKSLIATTMVDLGIVAYATGIMVGEGVSNLVFYALEQRKRRLERNRRQAQAEILSKLWQEAQDNEALKSVVERVSKEAGMVIVDNKIVFGDKEQ